MKREPAIAIFFGIFLGGILALFLITKNKETQLKNNKVIAPTPIANNKATGTTNAQLQPLEITSPSDGIIVDKNNITISGKAEKNSLIIIQSPVKDLSFTADKVTFSTDFPLALGENVIKIVSYSPDKNTAGQEKNLKIYYLDSEL